MQQHLDDKARMDHDEDDGPEGPHPGLAANGCTKGHERRCRAATSDEDECECACGGENHGAAYMKMSNLRAFDDNHTRQMNRSMGGELAAVMEELSGEHMECTMCGTVMVVNSMRWMGYKHTKGLEDSSGDRWWLYQECRNCDYQWAWHKIPQRLTGDDQ